MAVDSVKNFRVSEGRLVMIHIRLPYWLLGFLLVAILAAVVWPAPSSAQAGGVVMRSLVVQSDKILAVGGQTTITVRATVPTAESTKITLQTTLGSFGSRGGPNRIVLTLQQEFATSFMAKTELFADGRRGTALITARSEGSARATRVVITGDVAYLSFTGISDGLVLGLDGRYMAVRRV